MNERKSVKAFFEDTSKCKKIRFNINFEELKDNSESIPINNDLLSKLDLINSFVKSNSSLFVNKEKGFEKEDSYLLNYKLINIGEVLLKKDELKQLLKQEKCIVKENKIYFYDLENDFVIFLEEINCTITIEFLYCIENGAVENIIRDFTILSENFQSIFEKDNSFPYLEPRNSVLYFVLLKKYSDLFTKQDSETQKLIGEITENFFEAQIEGRNNAHYSIIALISLVLEQNLVKIYHKATKKFPSESHSLHQLNRDNTNIEYCDLKYLKKKKLYQLVHNSNKPAVYKEEDRIYQLFNDFSQNIRNKVFHYQRGVVLDLEKSVFNAIRYFIDILMEIENNGRYL